MSNQPGKRIEYIDAVRGFTMILVVFSHIYIPNDTMLNNLFILFRMPLFFFISGFISFRREQSWSGRETISRLKSKLRMMILPALILGLLFTLIYDKVPITDFFTRTTKMGYWFTFALFNMLVFYYTARHIQARWGKGRLEVFAKRLFVVGLLCSLLLTDVSYMGTVGEILTLEKSLEFMQFFTFGLLCSCNREAFHRTLDDGVKMAIILIGFFSLSWLMITTDGNVVPESLNIEGCYASLLNKIIESMAGYCGLITVYATFRHYGAFFAENKTIGKSLQFVGRNTLDVYLLHYFVLLHIPTVLRPYIAEGSGLLVPLVVGLTVSVIVVAITLLISRIIRTSDLLAYYLLGARDVTVGTKHRDEKI